jgi:hypothetical protein
LQNLPADRIDDHEPMRVESPMDPDDPLAVRRGHKIQEVVGRREMIPGGREPPAVREERAFRGRPGPSDLFRGISQEGGGEEYNGENKAS